MSALGHKRTFRTAIVMSALPPIADIRRTNCHVCFVPIADIPYFFYLSQSGIRADGKNYAVPSLQ